MLLITSARVFLPCFVSVLKIHAKVSVNGNRASALTLERQFAAACNVNGYTLPINVMDPLQEQ